MPPKQLVQAPPSLSPGPAPTDDAQDMLVIQDLMDTLDQLPPELTRVYSDLNELGAVLYCTCFFESSRYLPPVLFYVSVREGSRERRNGDIGLKEEEMKRRCES